MATPKVRVLIPYYGKFPSYFNLFLESCRYNEHITWIDFHFLTDLRPPSVCPNNVTFHFLELKDLASMVRKATSVDIPPIIHPRKLCDFKPMFGEIFSDYLSGVDFWAYGDIDLVYGDISNYINLDMLKNYDVISFNRLWISGALVLFRNVQHVNSLYKKSLSYRSVLLSDRLQEFDECWGKHNELRQGASIFEIDKRESMTYIVKKAAESGGIKAFFEDKLVEGIGKKDYFVFNAGTIHGIDGKERFLIHFVGNKGRDVFIFPEWNDIPAKFYITSTGLYKAKEFEGCLYRIRVFFRQLRGIWRRLGRIYPRLIKYSQKIKVVCV